MKIQNEDIEKAIRLTGAEDSSGLRMALAYLMVSIWDRGYNDGYTDAKEAFEPKPDTNPCPYTHSHTRAWCGYPMCRES